MMSLKQATKWAAQMTDLHGESWLVFKTHPAAKCNQYPGNVFNKGRYATCKASERADYEAGGAQFV